MTSRYTPLLRLGVGELADIYLGLQRGAEGIERIVVMKRALEGFDVPPHARELLVAEAWAVSHMRHPNVISAHELVEIEEGLVLVLEYLPGVSVHGLMQKLRSTQSPVPWPVAARVVADAARGLAYAHSAMDAEGDSLTLVHGDVSPKNLVITDIGVTKVVDFGNAKHRRNPSPAPRATAAYASPEQARRLNLDWRSDVFSLGVVLWELVMGRPLFGGSSVRETLGNVVNQRASPCKGPPVLSDLVTRMLVKDPAHRVVSMEEVAEVLETLAAAQAASVTFVRMFLQGEFGDSFSRRMGRVRALLRTSGQRSATLAQNLDYSSIEEALESTLLENIATRVDR